MHVIFTQSLCEILARIPFTACLVGINTLIFVWVGINTPTFEKIPFALNGSGKIFG